MYVVFQINTKYIENFKIHEEQNNSVKERNRCSWRFATALSHSSTEKVGRNNPEDLEDLTNTFNTLELIGIY